MSEFRELLNEQLKDPEFKREWDDIQPEMDVIRAMIKARNEQNLTQKELADRIGMNQADICKLENGTRKIEKVGMRNLRMEDYELANGLNMDLRIQFVPRKTSLR